MKKNNLIGSKIAFVLGILLLISSSRENVDGTSSSFLTANMMVLGSLAYIARRKQNKQPSTKWRIIEIISIIIIIYFIVLGIVSWGWYLKPIPFTIAPIWIAVAYIVAFRDGR